MIITNDEKALRVSCQNTELEEVGTLISTLENELSAANRLGAKGVGLAAIQIAIPQKIAIIRLDNIKLDLVNCEISQSYDKIEFKDEGCLSFPTNNIDTYRYQEVYVINNLVEPHSFIATGFLAIAIQHEIDHYNSVLYMDHQVPKLNQVTKKAKPNDKCPCGSNLKYKRCCGK
jgi:peptide deformylase